MQSSVGQTQLQTQVPANKPVQGQAVIQPQTQAVYCQQPSIQPQAQQGSPNYAGVNIQIFNPSVATPGGNPVYNVNAPSYQTQPQAYVPQCYPSNYYTQQFINPANTNGALNTVSADGSKTEEKKDGKKTEKREIVQLTDDYIKNLENYLNSQDKEIRMMGAKEVIARLQEDDSRKDDLALNALVNKMLQDPYTPIKVLAMGALDSRIVSGDDYTVGLLKNMQNSSSGYGQDAVQASNILLKMSGQTVEKEFEVKDKPKENKTQAKG
mgnify:CR=1 FL=1